MPYPLSFASLDTFGNEIAESPVAHRLLQHQLQVQVEVTWRERVDCSFGVASSSSSSRRPGLHASDSTSTLVGSALERKINDGDSYKERPDTAERLNALRELMKKDNLDY